MRSRWRRFSRAILTEEGLVVIGVGAIQVYNIRGECKQLHQSIYNTTYLSIDEEDMKRNILLE